MGFGRKSLDSVIVQEIDSVIDKLLESKDGIVEMKNTFNIPIINTLWQIVGSKKFDSDNEETKKMIDTVNALINSFSLMGFFPKLIQKILSVLGLCPQQDENILQMKTIMKTLISDHLKDIDYDNPRDLIDLYLMERDTNPNFNEEQLIQICNDFFIAGTETTSTTLLWAILYITIHPYVQDQCQNEIVEQIGSKPPSITDIQNLPFVMATLMEVQRISRVGPGSLPHVLMKDVTVHGFLFEEGTIFSANLSKFLMDPRVFTMPKYFNPSRFLDETGKIKKFEQFVPFSIGKRYCMGESLAKNEMFLFFVRMLQRVTFEETIIRPSPKNVNFGLTRIPKPFKVKIVAR